MTVSKCLKLVFVAWVSVALTACGGEKKYGYCAESADISEDRAWVWIYENAGIAQNRKCILCYLDRTDPNDRCYYIYNDDFMQNRTQDTCKQYACSNDPGAGDAWQEGHGGQGMIAEIYAGSP